MYSTYLPKNLNITIVLSRFIKLPLKFAKLRLYQLLTTYILNNVLQSTILSMNRILRKIRNFIRQKCRTYNA